MPLSIDEHNALSESFDGRSWEQKPWGELTVPTQVYVEPTAFDVERVPSEFKDGIVIAVDDERSIYFTREQAFQIAEHIARILKATSKTYDVSEGLGSGRVTSYPVPECACEDCKCASPLDEDPAAEFDAAMRDLFPREPSGAERQAALKRLIDRELGLPVERP